MEFIKENFMEFLRNEKHASANTLDAYNRDLSNFEEYFANDDILKLTDKQINEYLEYLANMGKSNSTISRVVSAIKSYYRYLFSRNLIGENFLDKIKIYEVDKKCPVILTKKEIERLLSQNIGNDLKDDRNTVMLKLLYFTGIRVSELISLKVDDINFANATLKVYKGRDFRYVKINKIMLDILKEYVNNTRMLLIKDINEQTLFLNSNGKKLTRQGFWKILKMYSDEAEIDKDITPQTLRHSFALHQLSQGMDVKNLQKILGHTDVATTMMYNKMLEDNIEL